MDQQSETNVAGVGLTLAIIKKYSWRENLFINKIQKGECFYDKDKNPVYIKSIIFKKKEYFADDPELSKHFSSFQRGSLKVRLTTDKIISASSLIKTTEFGGKSYDKVMFVENQAFNEFKQKFLKIKGNSEFIQILFRDDVYKVKDLLSTPGTPKSDFHFIDIRDQECLFISHKGGKRPSDFSQFSGICHHLEHPEIISFIEEVKKLTNSALKPRESFKRELLDDILRKESVFGYDTSSDSFNRNNVNYFAQGSLDFIEIDKDLYIITAQPLIQNPSLFEDPSYSPWIYCSYRSKAMNKKSTGIDFCRFGIYTRDFLKSAKKI